MIIDSHSHLHDEKFSNDLDEVLQRSREAGVSHFVTIGCDIETTHRARALAQRIPNVYFSAGFHPHDAKMLTDDSFAELSSMAKDKKCVAIGECGLDYYYNHSNQAEQQQAFIRQIKLAQELNLPLIIHLRDAHDDCVRIMSEHVPVGHKVVIHCFSGTLQDAEQFAAMGYYISLSGIITFKKPGDLPAVARTIPLSQLMIETDCPYLAPHPHRGKRNEPAYILSTLAAVAEARGQKVDDVAQALYQTTHKFFGFSKHA